MTPLGRCASCGHCDGLVIDEGVMPPFIFCDLVPTPGEAQRNHPSVEGGADITEIAIGEVMGRDIACVRADVSLEVVADVFVNANLSWLPVVYAEGLPLGIISRKEVTRELRSAEEDARRLGLEAAGASVSVSELLARRGVVADVMARGALTVPDGTTIGTAAARMVSAMVQLLLIVDDAGRVVGVLSSLDLLRLMATRGGYLEPPASAGQHGQGSAP